MLGNDIIDLELAKTQSNWRRRNYLSKIFSAEEQAMICDADDEEQMVWLLWSMKEAAYKIFNRLTQTRIYNPWEYHCCVEINGGRADGRVDMLNHRFKCKSEISEKHIHTVALIEERHFDDLIAQYLPNVKSYDKLFGVLNPGLHFRKDVNLLPSVYDELTSSQQPASVSHHGNYLAMVYYTGSL